MMIEFRKAEALLAMGRPQDAASLLDQLPARETPTPEFYRLRGRTFRAANRLYDAEAAFRDALALTPDDPHLLADLATVLLGQRRLKDAMPYAREAVSLRPDVTAWHCLIAVIAEGLERDTEAREALELAHRLSPADPEPPALLGFLLLRINQPAEAAGAFRAALAIDPGRAEALRGLARCHAAREEWAAARRLWLEALGINPLLRDRVLEQQLWLGQPLLAPVRLLVRVPIGASAALFVTGCLLIATLREPAALLLLLLSALPSLTRSWIRNEQP